MAGSPTALEGRRVLPRATIAAGVGVGLALVADITLGRSGLLAGSTPALFGLALLIELGVVAGFVLGRSPGQARDAAVAIEVAALAHDLRAPLATARTLLELLQSSAPGSLPGEAMDTAGRASSAVTRAQAVLEGALRSSSAEAAAPTTDLESVLDRALQSVAGGIAQSGAVVERGHLPAVRGDAIALERVLVNLVVNALVHARPGEAPRIEVGAQPEGKGWLISVRDHGPGIPDHIRGRAFEPGVRGFSAGGPPGFGLGLSTVKRLIEQQGGRAWIDPDTGDGTCVRMLLPAA